VSDVNDIAVDRFADFTIAVPERPGDLSHWRAFHVGRDCLAQASRTLRAVLLCGMQETQTHEVLMEDCQVNAGVVEKVLRSLYGKACSPTSDDALDLASLLDYWDPKGMPNPQWEQILAACADLMRDKVNATNALALWERALHLHASSAQEQLAVFIGSTAEVRANITALSEASFAALLDHPNFSGSEDAAVAALRAWGDQHAPEGTQPHEFLAQGPLVPLIRWQRVSDACLWASAEAGILSLEEAGEIGQVRYRISQNPECIAEQSLFEAPLRERACNTAAHDSTMKRGFEDLAALEKRFFDREWRVETRRERATKRTVDFRERYRAIMKRPFIDGFLRKLYPYNGRYQSHDLVNGFSYATDDKMLYYQGSVPRGAQARTSAITELVQYLTTAAQQFYGPERFANSDIDDNSDAEP
jgi:hypothetical protein